MVVRSKQSLAPRGAFKVLIEEWKHDPIPKGNNHMVSVTIQGIKVVGQTKDTWDIGTPVMAVIEHRRLLGVDKAYIKTLRLLALDSDDRLARAPKN